MAKVNKDRYKAESRRHSVTPKPLSPSSKKSHKKGDSKKRRARVPEKKDWEGAICSVCLESPHNAVLLLCSSYHKGCRPYICATSSRFSNCLEQYKKAYTKVTSVEGVQQSNSLFVELDVSLNVDKTVEVQELLCPLCRGQVKGWTVVEAARKHLNSKKRTCMHDKCLFSGTCKEIRKHVKAKHLLGRRPREIDPVLEEKWKKLESERERSDVISTIMSSTPGAVVLGDYVIEPYHHIYDDSDDDEYDSDDYYSSDDDSDDHFDLDSLNEGQGGIIHPRSRIHHFNLDEADFDFRHVVHSRLGAAAAARGRPRRQVPFSGTQWVRRRSNGSRSI